MLSEALFRKAIQIVQLSMNMIKVANAPQNKNASQAFVLEFLLLQARQSRKMRVTNPFRHITITKPLAPTCISGQLLGFPSDVPSVVQGVLDW